MCVRPQHDLKDFEAWAGACDLPPKPRCHVPCLRVSTAAFLCKKVSHSAHTTFSDGCLGLSNNEGRSKLRYAL